jgi:hypothetical protein
MDWAGSPGAGVVYASLHHEEKRRVIPVERRGCEGHIELDLHVEITEEEHATYLGLKK